ncbi:VOC family protein [Streptomyces sp. NPDC056983]|uniref:VOC family protein n=1 Tax=Streptomyces sp. NPDC056983 TaxID=3345987 RepID=UPI00363EDCB7
MIRWVCAFIDRPETHFGAACDFWTRVTGTRLSAPRGDRDEFVTLLPENSADPYLKAQAVAGPGGAHLDFAVDDLARTVALARRLGATPVHTEDSLEVLRSPGGQLFCLVPWSGEHRRPAPVTAPDGSTSRLDQVCVDLVQAVYEAEIDFWTTFTGWTSTPGTLPEFHTIRPPAGLPVRILLQRLTDPRPTGAHLDLACTDIEATRTWHESLGATLRARGAHWLVLRDPSATTYCLTSRPPK